MICMILSFLNAMIIRLFNKVSNVELKWILIIEVLKGIKPINCIKIKNDDILKKFISQIKSLHIITKFFIISINSFVVLIAIFISVYFYNLQDFIIYGLISIILYIIWIFFTI